MNVWNIFSFKEIRIVDGVINKHKNKEGQAKFYHKGGWTCLAFWDNSITENGWCVFALEGKYSYPETIVAVSKIFPQIWKRFNFPLHLANKK